MRIEHHVAQTVLATLSERLDGHVVSMTGSRARIGAELDDVVAVDIVGTRIARPREQVFYLMDPGSADIGAAAFGVAVDHAECRMAHQRADLASHHGHAGDGVRTAALDSRLHALVHQPVGLVPADLLPTRILVEALLGIRALQRLGDAVGIVELHDARRALAAYMPAADGTVGIARQFYHNAVDDMRFNGAVVEAHVAGSGDPLARFRIVGRFLDPRRMLGLLFGAWRATDDTAR